MPTIPSDVTTLTKDERLMNSDGEVLTKADKQLAKRESNLEAAGVTRKKVYEALREGLETTRKATRYDEQGTPLEVELPDYVTRHKYIETALKVFGDLVEVKTEVNVDASRKELNITVEEREELQRIRGKVHEALEVKKSG